MSPRPWILAFALLFAGCDRAPHAHDAAPPAVGGPERPSHAVTAYEDGLELFLEYPAFVVGEASPLVSHFTDVRAARAFRPITRGRVVATLRYEVGGEETFVAEEPLRDGIFKPIVRPGRAGRARLDFQLEGEQQRGRISAGEVVVHATLAAALAAQEEEPAGEPTVPYLKEQQWKTEYATTEAQRRVLKGGILANGELQPVPGRAAELAAPIAGRLVAANPVVHVGQRVKKGQLVASILPVGGASQLDRAALELELARARAALGLAERELARASELFTSRAIPEKQLDAARVEQEIAAATLDAAERQLSLYRASQGGSGGAAFELRAPIDGVIFHAAILPGAVVEPGARIAAIVDAERLWLVAQVYESDVAAAEHAEGARFSLAGFEREFVIAAPEGRRVAVGSVVDPLTRTVPVIFEFPNPEGRLKPGMFARATIFTGATQQGVAVPEEALLDDGGRPTVYVMDGGESFFKRRVQLGVRSDGWVQLLSGVAEGERVVSTGAYEIKLSTATGAIPEHGHQH